ncbi:MAG: thiolase family protein [Pseudomonadota bacterium]
MDAYIPYGGYWSTPFARWQGSLANLHSLKLGAQVAQAELERRDIPLDALDFGVLVTTVPQAQCFYGLPWVTGMMGAPHVAGPTINQACATSARCLQTATEEIGRGDARAALVLTADRTSNGPHLYYPNPQGFGGSGETETWVLDNFSCDPYAQVAMVETAENVAAKHGYGTGEQHEVVLLRYQQYERARENGFHKRYMTLPFEVPDPRFRKTVASLDGDEGVFPTTAEKLDALSPVMPNGSVTLGGQTHPADGNVGMVVTDRNTARSLSTDAKIEIHVRGFGQARTDKAHMPQATVPAARRALDAAGVDISDIQLVTTHNPFAVNDLVFSRMLNFPLERMNVAGCSLIWGHPQGPTGLRSVIELIESLVDAGGGLGLFAGCAAGDTAMAVVVDVRSAPPH